MKKARDRSTGFWWRAAEPIPARPEQLRPEDEVHAPDSPPPDSPPVSPKRHAGTTPPARHAGQYANPSPSPPRQTHETASRRQRLTAADDSIDLAASLPGSRAGTGHRGDSDARPLHPDRARPFRRPAPARRPAFRRRHALVAAGLAGAALFLGATGFGREVRSIGTFTAELDRVLIGWGLGIGEISLAGHHHTIDRDIFRALGASGATLLSLDVGAARRRIEALPWVESATIERVLPDKLKVEIRERTAVAAWLDGERTALLDRSGRVLTYIASFVPPELLQVAGAGAPEAAGPLAAALAARPALAARVLIARRIGGRRWDLELDNASTIRLAADPVEPSLERLAWLDRMIGVLEQPAQTVDLTVARMIAIAPVGAPAGERRRSAAAPHAAAEPL